MKDIDRLYRMSACLFSSR